MSTARSSVPLSTGVRLFDALKSGDFRLLWFASWLWYHARWMEVVVLGWVVLELTDSPWLVGLVGFFRMVPMPFLGLVAGIVADRANRRVVVTIAQVVNLLAMTTLFLLMFFGAAQFWHIAVVTLAMGTGWTMDFPSRRSVIADLVGASRIANAMSVDMAAMTGSKMMGPIYGGLLLSITGPTGAVLALVALYSIGFVLLVRVQFPERHTAPSREPVLRMLAEGLAYVMRSRLLLGVVLVTVVANLCLFPFVLMVPVFARDVLGVGPALMGVLAASDGFGSLLGAVYLASRGEIRSPGKIFVYGTTMAMAFILGFALSGVYSLSIVLLFVAGLAISGFGAMQGTIMLVVAPEAMRGRAMGVVMVAIGASPVGILVTGAVAEAWGAPVAIAANCIVALAAMAGILIGFPALRRMQASAGQADAGSSTVVQASTGTPPAA